MIAPHYRAMLGAKSVIREISEWSTARGKEIGYDNVFGARPLKRFIQKYAETPIARRIIENNPEAGSTLTLDAAEDGLYLK